MSYSMFNYMFKFQISFGIDITNMVIKEDMKQT